MIIFHYDKSFEGLLTSVFEAYARKTFPDKLLMTGEPDPLFIDTSFEVITDTEKSDRVWKALEKKLEKITLNMIRYVWLSELDESDELIFRYICKNLDHPTSIELNFADPDVLALKQIAQKVSKEKHRLIEFVRFQQAADNLYFAPVSPDHNALPLTLSHFKDRFRDQKWIIYDTKRDYGYYYDLKKVEQINLSESGLIESGKLNEDIMAIDEKAFQKLWKAYFKSMTIKERINLKLHRQNLPQRYWKYLTEKQD